jgi:hypothetical protein
LILPRSDSFTLAAELGKTLGVDTVKRGPNGQINSFANIEPYVVG